MGAYSRHLQPGLAFIAYYQAAEGSYKYAQKVVRLCKYVFAHDKRSLRVFPIIVHYNIVWGAAPNPDKAEVSQVNGPRSNDSAEPREPSSGSPVNIYIVKMC